MTVSRLATGVVAGSLLAVAALSPASVGAQECHPAYSGRLPVVYDLDCEEIGWAVYQVYDPAYDPYGLDVWDGVGNGWTCDGIG
jgi:hypothetical protein